MYIPKPAKRVVDNTRFLAAVRSLEEEAKLHSNLTGLLWRLDNEIQVLNKQWQAEERAGNARESGVAYGAMRAKLDAAFELRAILKAHAWS